MRLQPEKLALRLLCLFDCVDRRQDRLEALAGQEAASLVDVIQFLLSPVLCPKAIMPSGRDCEWQNDFPAYHPSIIG